MFPFFQADVQYKALESKDSLTNLDGQLHTQDKLEGGDFQF